MLGAGGVFHPMPLGDAPRLSEGNHEEGTPASLVPVLLRVETDLVNEMLLALRASGVAPLLGEGNALLNVEDLNGPGSANSSICSKSTVSTTPFIGVGATGLSIAGTGVRARRGRPASGRLLPSPV